MAKKLQSDYSRLRAKCCDDEVTGCWLWQGTLDKDGYGAQVKIGSHTDGSRRAVRPHRWFYAHFKGPIPEGLVIDHLCRNRRCQNPEHLEAVTHVENTKRGARATATHCHRGHPLSGENVRLSKGRWQSRVCRTCFREYQSVYQKANGGKHQAAYRERLKEKRKSELATA